MGVWDSFSDEDKHAEGDAKSCPQEGGTCPACGEGSLRYNGKLELVCDQCQAVFSAGFT